ncbi:SDR family NAD(P)-dependent oxidoreductase [Novosphingobium sp. KN65.2]|uniref:SDR family NAD(P)-dependent oxidoreductase n=1 Tax=Novosphingobium sp. KN65.2 TaxID=1478134 RepID=UPI0005DFE617|nr:SDR family oxidoreductase [Novosphingobium sp. KN65.2]CDO34474.1 Short-chain dehydrogenase/reductase SDR [Novosphingobium sp. KN65.2]
MPSDPPITRGIAFDFSEKSVLVTGAGSGIGRAIADAFDACGAQVFAAEIDGDLCADLETAGMHVLKGDVCAPDFPAMAAERVAQVSGKLDVLVNNVGHFVHPRPFAMLSAAEAGEVLDVNLGQLLRMTSAMLPLLRRSAPGSAIINVTSIEAYRGIPGCSVYAAAKAGIAGFTKSLALELGPEGIRVNDIAPETTDTRQVPLDYMIPAENRVHEDKWIPLGRLGRPQDCAGAALYLASPLASWVTGTAIHVDGGALAASGWTRTQDGEWTVVPIVSGNGIRIPS